MRTQEMKANRFSFILLVLVIISAGCLANEKPADNCNKRQKAVVQGCNEFAFDLYAKLRVKDGNLFFSPYSISTAMAMVYAGARGKTEAQICQVLHLSDDVCGSCPLKAQCEKKLIHSAYAAILTDLNEQGKKGNYQLSIANALWAQKGYGFLKDYLELIETNYGGGFNEVDFAGATEAARQKINSWVDQQTNHKIKDLIAKGALGSMTRLVLTNAIYFKGNWASQFDEAKTRPQPFMLAGGDKVQVPMMNQTAEFKYTEQEDFQGLQLGYVDDELSMIILLPRENLDLAEFEKKLTAKNLAKWSAGFVKRQVRVSIPKFKQLSQFSLAGILRSMGMTEAFSTDANFSGMNGRRDLFISAVIHKAFVDVNEEGTEAAAATAVTMRVTAVQPKSIPVFRADRPFLLIIRDNQSGNILFLGRVMHPKS
jgi:serpin B